MSTPPTAKRRRLSNPNSALHKPFRSPLKAPTTSSTTAPTPSRPRQTPYTPHRSSTLKFSRTATQIPTTPGPDTEVLAAQKHIRDLETRARDLRNQIAILSQAASISATPSSSATDATQPRSSRLEALTHKWRLASQAAADTIFPDFSARIKDAGGFSSFHTSKSKSAFQNEDSADSGDEEGWRDELGEVLTKGEKQRRREARETKREVQVKEQDTELTMGKMLRVLGIEEEIVGWDEVGQMWV